MMGIVVESAAGGGIIGTILAGWMFDTLGNYDLIWAALSASIILAIISMLMMKPEMAVK